VIGTCGLMVAKDLFKSSSCSTGRKISRITRSWRCSSWEAWPVFTNARWLYTYNCSWISTRHSADLLSWRLLGWWQMGYGAGSNLRRSKQRCLTLGLTAASPSTQRLLGLWSTYFNLTLTSHKNLTRFTEYRASRWLLSGQTQPPMQP
jgi:hypothetical protein